MGLELISQVSVISVLEEVIQQHGNRIEDVANLVSRNTDEASLQRNDAAGWLRKTVGVVLGKDLPAEPSEEEFRLGLRSGKILCTVLNKIKPGSVPKVLEGPSDSIVIPDGAPLSPYQLENLRNFIAAIEEMGIPTFETSDLEQGGNSSRIVQSVLALKSYSEWKRSGGIGRWKYLENSKPPCFPKPKPFTRRNSEPFMHTFSRTMSLGDKSADSFYSEQSEISDAGSMPSLHLLVRAALLNKKQDEIPMIVESMIKKVSEEYERRLASHTELIKSTPNDTEESVPDNSLSRTASSDDKIKSSPKDTEESVPDNSLSRTASCDDKIKSSPKDTEESVPDNSLSRTASCDKVEVEVEVESPAEETIDDESSIESEKKELPNEECNTDEEATRHLLKQKTLVEQQRQHLLELKHSLHATKVGMELLQVTYREEFNNLGSIRVYCRVRPSLSGQSNNLSCVEHIDDTTITVLTPSKTGKEGRKSFTFNKIFGPSVTQVFPEHEFSFRAAEVFSDTQPLIRSVLDGYNVCIFAYGQTGSGKTYTMSGPTELTEEGLGVNYRALGDLFELSNQRKETISYEISVQMLEIYNEQVRDLLAADEIRNSSQNGINVPEAHLVRVSSTSDVINLMNLGQKNRTVFSTAMNDRSSRSHSCLTVHVQGKDLTSGNIIHGCMHLVDLAGSERVDKSEVMGDRLKEAQHINKSLSALGDVIAALASKGSHVPYRNSKLTQLLQDSLGKIMGNSSYISTVSFRYPMQYSLLIMLLPNLSGGQAKTLMFVHIAPEYEASGETISTLKFAERVATVELGAAKVNKDSGEVKELKGQISSLKAALTTAKKEEEPEQLQLSQTISISSSPEKIIPSLGTSPSLPKSQSSSDHSSSVTNAENESSTTSRRDSLEIQEMLANPSLWPPLGKPASSAKEDNKDSASGRWNETLMVNKNDKKDPIPAAGNARWNPTKVYPEQNLNKLTANKNTKGNQDHHQQRFGSTDDSSDLDECLEIDSVWQSSIPKVTNNNSPNGLASKPKKQQYNHVAKPKNTDFKSAIPSLIPSPSTRKPSNGANPNTNKPKRKTGYSK
ncbi:Kinesin-4 -like protein [Gossypium arboreum]|uniref:Kinesin-4-like protein n=1 Tax=Gossypium arboreum TaxID=29729 RepID=A0A0B0P6N0_GOSAR|nr:Kinesin-4 -like protein [Gossypium arboreum]